MADVAAGGRGSRRGDSDYVPEAAAQLRRRLTRRSSAPCRLRKNPVDRGICSFPGVSNAGTDEWERPAPKDEPPSSSV